MTLIMDDVDFSDYLYRYGVAVQYQKVYGDGGGTTLSGEEIVDLRAVKTVITAACNPLTSARLSALSETCKSEYVFVRYTDPEAGADVEKTMIPELSAVNKSLTVDGVTYWKDAVITLRER